MIDELKAWIDDEEFIIKKQSLKKVCEIYKEKCIKCPLLMMCEEPHFDVKDENNEIYDCYMHGVNRDGRVWVTWTDVERLICDLKEGEDEKRRSCEGDNDRSGMVREP